MSKLTFKADCEIQAADGKQPRVEIRAYTGGVMRVPGFGAVALDIAGMELSDIPLLADHENKLQAIAGTGAPDVRGGELHVVGTLATGTAAAEQILALHRAGVKLQASIGAEPLSQKFIDGGESINANGRNIVAPAGGFAFVTKSKLREVSFVAAGADSQTSVSIAAMRKGKVMRDSSFQDFVSSMLPDTNVGDLTSAQLATLHANYQGRSDATDADFAAAAPMIQASSDPVALEEKRLRQIEAACRGNWNDDSEQITTLKAKAIGGELSVDDLLFELRNIRKEQTMKTFSDPPPIMRGSRDQHSEAIEAAFCLKGGLANPERHFSEQVLDYADKLRKGLTLQTFLMEAACANGYHARPGEGINDGNLRAVLSHAFAPQIRATGWTTHSAANVLSNVANKHLLQGFEEMGDEWKSIAEVKPVSDFKENTFVRLLDNLPYNEVGNGGELEHGTLGDDTMTGKAHTYGVICSITRHDLINDDQGAFMDIPRRIGRNGGQKLRRLFWTAFMAADSFFSEANGNLIDGVLTDDGADLATALIAFRAMRSPAADGSRLLGGAPAVMLVSPNDEITARRLINSSGIVAGGGSTTTTAGNGNPFANLAKLVVVDWLADTSLGGTADTNEFYLFRSASLLPAMLVLALNGRVEPVVETAQADFHQLGIQMRGYSDIGVARGEPLAGLKVSGEPIET